MKGSTLLKVTSILMIIGGAFVIVMGLLAVVGSFALFALLGAMAAVLLIACVLYLVAGVVELIAGIVGVKNNANPAKAKSCITMGIIVIAMLAVYYIVNLLVDASGLNILTVLINFVIPVLYLIGAFQLKNMANDLPTPPQDFVE